METVIFFYPKTREAMQLNHLSPMNQIHARSILGEPNPEVGMGATMLVGSDRYACTIHRIFTYQKGKIVLEVTHDESKLVSGSAQSESQEYEYTPRPDGAKHLYMKGDNGLWQEVQYKVFEYGYDDEKDERTVIRQSSRLSRTASSRGLKIGVRDEYRDPSF